jgi:hypothetical protein
MLLTSTPQTKSLDAFEASAAASVAAAAGCIPADIRPLIFASPVCARSSDVSLVWHSGYREKHRTVIVLRLLAALPLDLLKGMVRLLPPFRRLRYTITGVVRFLRNAKANAMLLPSRTMPSLYMDR